MSKELAVVAAWPPRRRAGAAAPPARSLVAREWVTLDVLAREQGDSDVTMRVTKTYSSMPFHVG